MSGRKKIQRAQAIRRMQDERNRIRKDSATLRVLLGQFQVENPDITSVVNLIQTQAATIARHEQTIAALRAMLDGAHG